MTTKAGITAIGIGAGLTVKRKLTKKINPETFNNGRHTESVCRPI